MERFTKLFASVLAAVVLVTITLPAQSASAVTVKAASAVRSVVVSDGWNASEPRLARASIRWTRPAATYGATLVGYRIEKSTNKTSWKVVVSNTGSTSTRATIDTGLSVGVQNFFRVRAITKRGNTTKIGLASAISGRILTAKPSAPALLGLETISSPLSSTKIVRWLPQTSAERGGLAVTYSVSAQLVAGPANTANATNLSCKVVSKNSCSITGLAADAVYRLSLTAKNMRGSESHLSEFAVSDAEYAKQWYLSLDRGIAAARAWTATRGTSSVVVAVLDSGITPHPEFEGQLVDGYDFVSETSKSGDGDGRDADPTDPGDAFDSELSSWHGTHVAGIIGARSNEVGITGIAPGAKIQPIRVLGTGGQGASIDLALGIRWAAGQDLNGLVASGETLSGIPLNKTPAKVINLSMAGIGACPASVQLAVEYAISKGVTLVSAAGNGDDNFNPVENFRVYPTNCLGTISVGATGINGDAAFYSNFGVDISAPGGDQKLAGSDPAGTQGLIYSTSNTGVSTIGQPFFRGEQGTSMAAPVVSGIVALMYSLRPNINTDQVWAALKASVMPFPAGSSCAMIPNRCGLGQINAATALDALIGITG
jgi:serine protease